MTLSDEYLREAGHQARRRIIAAGLRLAVMLGAELDAAGAQRTGGESEVSTRPSAALTHWLNVNSGVRHNRSCHWFGETASGRMARADEGQPCGVCGG